MDEQHSISIRTLVYCLLTGRNQISESAIPDAPEAFEGADRIIPDIVDAASRGHIVFHGIPTQTRFPISERRFLDMSDRAVAKAISFLNRAHELHSSNEK